MNTQVIPEQGMVEEYVRRVREALGDLPVEDVDDLVQGMEADLTEVAGEGSGSLVERLGSPEAYAAELRSAARLPEPSAPNAVDGFWIAERARLRGHREALVAAFPALPATVERLAPLWWAARGATLGWLLGALLGGGGALLVLVGVGISIWWALRGRPAGRVGRVLSAFAGALAIVAMLPLSVWALERTSPFGSYDSGPAQDDQPQGLSQDGRGISQLYAYDREGSRLDDVRIYDQDGAPVLVDPSGTGNPWVDASGRTWANVYPGPAAEGDGWVVRDETGAWHPPMAISPLRTKVPVGVGVDVLPDDGSGSSPGDPDAPTEATPSTPPAGATSTSGPTGATSAPPATTPPNPRPTGSTRPTGTATTR